MPVVSLKVSKNTKEEVERLMDSINWAGEIWALIGDKSLEKGREETLGAIESSWQYASRRREIREDC